MKRKFMLQIQIFSTCFLFRLLRGNPATVLKDPGSVVLTETTAKKYFGSIDNAMGKVVEMDKDLQLKVTGIAKDVPSNSHLDFDLVVPIQIITTRMVLRFGSIMACLLMYCLIRTCK